MIPLIACAAAFGGLVFWSTHRWLRRRPLPPTDGAPTHGEFGRPNGASKPTRAARINTNAGPRSPTAGAEVREIAVANDRVTERLWRVAFGAPSTPVEQPADPAITRGVSALLTADRLDAKFFPRRPALMPQLMRALEDPRAATERLSRIVAHDPVLASDVLRLANSSRFRSSEQPIETLQRAIVAVGVDALRGLVAIAMMQPVFRASRNNFPRFPRMLWDRTERAARAAEAYAARVSPQDQFEAQLAVLVNALGPLAVYGVILEVYARQPDLVPNPALCVTLTSAWGARTALRIAHYWETSPRLVAAVELSSDDSLPKALYAGELLGTLSLLESQNVIEVEETLEVLGTVGMGREWLEGAKPRTA